MKLYNFSLSYMLNNTVIVSKDPSIHRLEDLKDKKVSVYTGTTHEKIIEELKGKNANDSSIVRKAFPFLALRDVIQGKSDALIGDEMMLKFMANRYQKYGLVSVVEPNQEEDYFGIVIHKGNTELKSKIDAAISQMKADGTLDKGL